MTSSDPAEHPDQESGSEAPVAGDPADADAADAAPADAEPEWKRRRRLAEIFGDVLPATTSDERGPGNDGPRESANDAWLRAQVPPHHGS